MLKWMEKQNTCLCDGKEREKNELHKKKQEMKKRIGKNDDSLVGQ